MKLKARVAIFAIVLFSLLLFPYCRGKAQLAPTTRPVITEINAQKLDVFDATSQVFLGRGFSILTSNERLGLITTDYKQLDESWGGGIVLRMFGKKKPEVQLTTNVTTRNGTSVLTILPKGRVQQKKGSYYDEIQLSDGFLMKIADIGQEIKRRAEAKQ
jgi:hypothetical protein